MKVVGIIAEYNPFHKGHAYQIRYAKERLGADYVIVAMSGPFTQRGTPALFDKYSRAGHALACGADLVLELPVVYATAQCPGLCYRRCGSFAKCRAGGYPLIRKRMS